MKVLLLVPKRYSLYESFESIFSNGDIESFFVDYQHIVGKWENRVHMQYFRFPDKWRLKWEAYYFEKINKFYREEFQRVKPDLVMVYNDELLVPETVEYFKERGAKVAFFLGDHPFYTNFNRYYLSLLFLADAIYVPDSFWMKQLAKMGLKKLYFFQTDLPRNQYYKKVLPARLYDELKSEVLYVGVSYSNSWGYKKARFLDHFTPFDLKIYGNKHWKKFFRFFPGLEPHFWERTEYIPISRMNEMYNAAKIIPVDGNPGILAGLHQRVWEALGAGALPLMEWQDDLTEIFGNEVDLPAVKSYDDIEEMTRYYLDHEEKRVELVNWMRNLVDEKYAPEKNLELFRHSLQLN